MPFGQDALVGGLHVRVRADDRRDPAVEVPAHRDLLRRRLGVEVDEDDARPARASARSRAAPTANGSSSGGMKMRPIRLMHADRLAGACPAEVAAAAGRAGGKVRRPQQLRLPRDVVEHFLLVPDVIAGRHHVDAVAEDGVGDVAGDAEAGGGVLDVGDDEVDARAARRAPAWPGARSRARACRRCRR